MEEVKEVFPGEVVSSNQIISAIQETLSKCDDSVSYRLWLLLSTKYGAGQKLV